VRLFGGTLSLILLAAACGKAADKRPADPQGWRTPTTCGSGEGRIGPQQAVQCAELFIARNGYTTAPAIDSPYMVLASVDRGRPIDRISQDRYNTIQPRAAAVCPGVGHSGGYMIAFARVGGDTASGRAVTMSANGADLHLDDSEFMVAGARRGQFGCRPVPR